jgi:hypothetical protein
MQALSSSREDNGGHFHMLPERLMTSSSRCLHSRNLTSEILIPKILANARSTSFTLVQGARL